MAFIDVLPRCTKIQHEGKDIRFDTRIAEKGYLTPVVFSYIPTNLFWLHFNYGITVDLDLTHFGKNGCVEFYIKPSDKLSAVNLTNALVDIITYNDQYEKAQRYASLQESNSIRYEMQQV